MLTIATLVLVAMFRSAWLEPGAQRRLYQQVIGGLWLGLAGWAAGAVLEAWAPMWQMLIVGVALSVLSGAVPLQFRRYARPAADFLTIALLSVLSVIPVQLENVIAAAFVFAVAGFVVDWIRSLISPRLSPLLLAMPAVLVLLLAVQVRQPGNFGSRLLAEDPWFPLRVALVVPAAGDRLPLQGRTAAWLLENPVDEEEERGTAIVLHGNNRLGSQQPSGVMLQGALMRAGYDVLSVDHPGFGASPAPPASAHWSAWDPTSGALEALRYLRSHDESALETIVVGHSMGVDVALKLAADRASAGAVYLWGGSLDRPSGPNWVSGFHRERNIPCCLPPDSLNKIRDEFYGGGDRFAAELPADHAPVHFVSFGIEHADVTRDREPLYAAITEPKTQCDFGSVSHYFNTLAIRGFVLLDTLTLRRTADIFASGIC
jgi:pimeloyl-ACP methyl ester carboxylesterase